MLASASKQCFAGVTQCGAMRLLQDRLELIAGLATIKRKSFPRDSGGSWAAIGEELESLVSEAAGGRGEGIEEIGHLCHFLVSRRCHQRPRNLDLQELCCRISDNSDVAKCILRGWVRAHPMRGELFPALFGFLRHFMIPNQSSHIDRILELFSDRWFEANQQDAGACPFANSDAVYVLCYSIIMLNTDAHNPIIREKMSMRNFCAANRGINDGEDLPQEYLETVWKLVTDPEQRLLKDMWEDEESLVSATAASVCGAPKKSCLPDGCCVA